MAWSATYDSFGKTTIGTETITNNLRFPGQYYDTETGLHYNWNRYYDPETGRYMRVDPIGEGLNLYLYVQNNPLKYIDPRGLTANEFQNNTNSQSNNDPTNVEPKGFWERVGQAAHSVADNVKKATGAVANFTSNIAKTVTAPHFEGRDSRNVNLPTYAGVISKESQWDLRSPSQTVFHDNDDDYPELKYTNPDGREAVFDGKTHEIVTDSRYKGTYNYVVPAPFPDKWWDIGALAKWAVKGAGHIVADVAPYAIGGNVRGGN